MREGATGADVGLPRRRQGRGLGRPGRVRAPQRARHRERDRRLPRGGRAAARARGHRGGADGGRAARERRRDRAAASRLAGALLRRARRRPSSCVRDANGDGLETVVIRPRFVWGRGDTTLLPALVELVRSGRFRWVGGGRPPDRHHARRQHGRGPLAGRDQGAGPGASTSSPTASRWCSASSSRGMLETQGVTPPTGSVPTAVARVAAGAAERLWRLLRRSGPPPLTRFAIWVSSQECTIDIRPGRARARLPAGQDRATRAWPSCCRLAGDRRSAWRPGSRRRAGSGRRRSRRRPRARPARRARRCGTRRSGCGRRACARRRRRGRAARGGGRRWGRRSGRGPTGCGRCGSSPPGAARRARARRPRRRGSRPGGRAPRAPPRASRGGASRSWWSGGASPSPNSDERLNRRPPHSGHPGTGSRSCKRYREAARVAAEGTGPCQGSGAEGFHRILSSGWG